MSTGVLKNTPHQIESQTGDQTAPITQNYFESFFKIESNKSKLS